MALRWEEEGGRSPNESQGQNLALTVLSVQYLLGGGLVAEQEPGCDARHPDQDIPLSSELGTYKTVKARN